jgi:hypothetical protein
MTTLADILARAARTGPPIPVPRRVLASAVAEIASHADATAEIARLRATVADVAARMDALTIAACDRPRALSRVTPERVCLYLQATGWTSIGDDIWLHGQSQAWMAQPMDDVALWAVARACGDVERRHATLVLADWLRPL